MPVSTPWSAPSWPMRTSRTLRWLMNLSVHLTRSLSTPKSIRRPTRWPLLTLLKADLTSISSAPAMRFWLKARSALAIRTATASTHERLRRQSYCPS